jgi:hypothetical protein
MVYCNLSATVRDFLEQSRTVAERLPRWRHRLFDSFCDLWLAFVLGFVAFGFKPILSYN